MDRSDADIAAFRAEGYVRLGHLLPEATLRRLQTSFRREQAVWLNVHADAQRKSLQAEQDRDGWRSSGYFDVPRILETDDAYLELLEHPRLVALLRAAVGEDVMVEHVQGRTLLPVADHTERDWNSGGSYTGWRECTTIASGDGCTRLKLRAAQTTTEGMSGSRTTRLWPSPPSSSSRCPTRTRRTAAPASCRARTTRDSR